MNDLEDQPTPRPRLAPAIVLALLALGAGGASLAVRPAIESALRARADAAGVELAWQHLDWSVDLRGRALRVELREVRARRGAAWGQARALGALVNPWSRRVRGVVATGVRGGYDGRGEAEFRSLGVEAVEAGVRVRGEGTARAPSLGAPLRFAALATLHHGEVDLYLSGPDGTLLSERALGPGRARAGDLRVRLSADGAWSAEAPLDVAAAGWRLRGTTARLSGPRERPTLRFEGGTVTRAPLGGGEAGRDRPGSGPPDLPAGLRIEASDLLAELDDPRLAGTLRLEHVVATWSGGVGHLTARALGGEIEVVAPTVPGAPRPDHLLVSLRGVDVGAAARLVREHLPAEIGGRLDAQVTVIALGDALPGPAMAHVAAALREGTLAHHALAREPIVGLEGRVDAVVTWRPDLGTLALDDVRLASGPLSVRAALHIDDLDDAPIVRLSAALDPIDCQQAWEAVPAVLRGPVADARFTGRAATRIELDLPWADPFHLDLRVTGFSRACGVTHLGLAPGALPGDVTVGGQPIVGADAEDVAWMDEAFARTVPEAHRSVQVGPGAGEYVPIGDLPRYVAPAMWLSEEVGFSRGLAISPPLIERVLKFDLANRRFVYGGSTITQQLVKNLFLDRRKTLARKLQEAVIAARVADALTRARVLELYLNCIEFAPDVYGIGAAARYYFAKPAFALTPAEAVFLARMKPSPRFGQVMKLRGYSGVSPKWRRFNRNILNRLENVGALSAADRTTTEGFVLRWDAAGRYLGDVRDTL